MNSPAATLKLEYPVSVGKGDPVYELSFRRLRASDFKKLPDDDGDQQIALLARITSQPRSTIEELGFWLDQLKDISETERRASKG